MPQTSPVHILNGNLRSPYAEHAGGSKFNLQLKTSSKTKRKSEKSINVLPGFYESLIWIN